MESASSPASPKLRSALMFVVLLSLVDLLADFTYEGARSVMGPFLALLGASGTLIGVSAGFGELAGYVLRLVSGTVADRTRRYWLITISGYAVNLLAVPLLALAGHLPLAIALLIAERTGRAIRAPSRDAMLSHATHEMGRGWGFGLHEAADQTGAVLGPLVMAAVIAWKSDVRLGFGLLAIPAVLAVSTIVLASRLFPQPDRREVRKFEGEAKGLGAAYWIFLIAAGLIAAGYSDFALMAYHLQRTAKMAAVQIPLLYALGMGMHGAAALVFGRLYDRKGLKALIIGVAVSCAFAPLVFWGDSALIVIGVVLWGVGLGAVESMMKAAVADMSSRDRRGTAYGIFYAGYGALWFLGSALMGWLYDHSLPGLVAFSMVMQALAVPLILLAHLLSERKPASA